MKLQILVIFALVAVCYGMSLKPEGNQVARWWNPFAILNDLWTYSTEKLNCIIQCLQGNPPKTTELSNNKNVLIDTINFIVTTTQNYWGLFVCATFTC